MDISDSGFITPDALSPNWSDITLLQQRRQNTIYSGKRYGKRFLIKAISTDYQSLTDIRMLQEKEFTLGFSLSHPNIAETYSLEDVPDLGRCIVMEYIDGMTLAEWIAQSPTRPERERVLSQLLDVLEYIHSLQLVHHDLKSSNILITHNGHNIKLIDFGLSDTDSTAQQNTVHTDIQLLGNIMQLILPKHYTSIRKLCILDQYPHIGAVKQAIQRVQTRRKRLPYIISVMILVISTILLVRTYLLYQESEQMAQVAQAYSVHQTREKQMLEQITHHVTEQIARLQRSADTIPTYLEFTQKHYQSMWVETAKIRDSIADLYQDDPTLHMKAVEHWAYIFGEKFQELDNHVKQSKPFY